MSSDRNSVVTPRRHSNQRVGAAATNPLVYHGHCPLAAVPGMTLGVFPRHRLRNRGYFLALASSHCFCVISLKPCPLQEF